MAGVFIMGNLRVLGLHTLAKRGKAKGNSFPGAGRGAAYPTPYTPAFRPLDLVPSGLVGAVPGLDPLGSSGCAESEEPDGPRSVLKSLQGACAGLDLLLRVSGDPAGAAVRSDWVEMGGEGARRGNLGLGSRAARGREAHSAHSRPASVPPPRGCSERRAYRKAWRRRALAAPERVRTSQGAGRGGMVRPPCPRP